MAKSLFDDFDDKPELDMGDLNTVDDLFSHSRRYRGSREFKELLNFIVRFRQYKPYNSFLIHAQNPHAYYVATATQWEKRFGRRVNADARPLVILLPFGPAGFVYDLADTDGPPLPKDLEEPFRAYGTLPDVYWWNTLEQAERMGIEVVDKEGSKFLAGYVRAKNQQAGLGFNKPSRGRIEKQVAISYQVVVNSTHSLEVQYATLVHELAHVLLGHLGKNSKKDKWRDRSRLEHDLKEIEAETVSYMVCKRIGIETNSESYLANYLDANEEMPGISLHDVLLVAGKIEGMRERLEREDK